MKRNSAVTILLMIVICLVIAILSAYLAAWIFHIEGDNFFLAITIPAVFLFFVHLTNLFMFPIARNTMKKGTASNNFGRTTTFINRSQWRIRTMLCIDEETGRVAYTSALNPFKFQMADAKELSKVRTGYDRGPFGGTRYVYFEFFHGNNRFRIPTFSTRSMYFTESRQVQDAIATGENICNLILKFNPQGRLTADKINNREMPFIKIGIPATVFASVSIFVAVIAMIIEVYISSIEGWKDDMRYGMTAFALVFIALALSVTGLLLGIRGLKTAAAEGPVRGLGFSKAATVMSSIVIAVLLLTFALFVFV